MCSITICVPCPHWGSHSCYIAHGVYIVVWFHNIVLSYICCVGPCIWIDAYLGISYYFCCHTKLPHHFLVNPLVLQVLLMLCLGESLFLFFVLVLFVLGPVFPYMLQFVIGLSVLCLTGWNVGVWWGPCHLSCLFYYLSWLWHLLSCCQDCHYGLLLT